MILIAASREVSVQIATGQRPTHLFRGGQRVPGRDAQRRVAAHFVGR